MHTGRMVTLTDRKGDRQMQENHELRRCDDLHWLVMQSLKHQKWVLAVVKGDFAQYQVTDVMSANVDLMVQYADYLNKGKTGGSMDAKCQAMLEQLRERYLEREL